MNYLIRKIKEEDNLTLASIIRASFIEFDAPKTGTVYSDSTTDALFELFENAEKSILYVAELDGKVVGSCGIYPTAGLPKDYCELVKFYLAAEARNLGIGKALFEKSLEKAANLGYTQVYIESQPSFSKAVKIYEAYGFQYLKEALGKSGHGNCDVWMLKALKK